ncbi:uncharacterized protein LOC118456539 isoform X1 [Anopheles albimanus]|uniref:uncharacterized protein LOC118456539 isoform X1 n=1 Tax=Anopheles albimanus TaxID=7167 RepID=UPI00163EDB6D|nr:uncharacterized protein LOC118456539 isoform X1 [Anopheles albimanus]XP_035773280.1 uncharacterized protein LOC118456539 isoform X1 [Anopheles albimanus]XP_035773281.1 uncharacterized protein LOC118456539 isoform X1 [Anopheles albimanus]
MKTTLGLWTAMMALVCVSVHVSALPYSDSRIVQDNSYLSLKRTKPSLSIVNPLDVLRQRIILEMARRQMRENTRQVELNKALLREIGKRSSNFYDGSQLASYDPDRAYYDRKLYNQQVGLGPEHSLPGDDELEAMMDSLLRSSRFSSAGKQQHVRSVNDRLTSAPNLEERRQQVSSSQTQPQSPQLRKMFNNEQEDLKTNNEDTFTKQSLNVDDQDDDDDQNRNENSDTMTDGERYMESNRIGEQPRAESHQPLNDQSTGNEYQRQRFVYGMYKNRFAN